MPRRLHRSCSSLLDSRRPPQRPKPVPPPPCAINTSSSSRLATARGTKLGAPFLPATAGAACTFLPDRPRLGWGTALDLLLFLLLLFGLLAFGSVLFGSPLLWAGDSLFALGFFAAAFGGLVAMDVGGGTS